MGERIIFDRNALKLIPERLRESNKGSYGHVLVIAGSRGMSGAAYLSALAAYRTGAGLVKILTVEENRAILQTSLPEALISCYEPWSDDFDERIRDELSWATVIIIGPGLGQEAYVERLVELVLSESYVPLIVDADALNTIASYPSLTRFYTDNIIITPHPGEMARLTGKSVPEIMLNPENEAYSYHDRYGITCVLKSHKTVTAGMNDNIYINESGSPALAKAGSGDVLTGIIAGLICLGLEDYNAAALGVYIHGLCGEHSALRIGEHSVIARDIISSISYIISERF